MKKLFATFALCICVSANSFARMQPDAIHEYKIVEDHSLTVHVFNPENHQSSDARPAVVMFFGGGWIGGQPRAFYRMGKHFASRGIVFISADYRTRNRHETAPKESVKDGKSAMRWIRQNAERLGVNPEQIIAGGASAGGQLAAAAATLPALDEPGEDTTISSKPAALVLINPVVDNSEHGYGYDRVADYWQDFSPMHNINPEQPMPPTLFILGTEDQYIPVTTGEKYCQLTEQTNARCDLVILEGEPHGFLFKGKYEETIQIIDEFLTSLDYLPTS